MKNLPNRTVDDGHALHIHEYIHGFRRLRSRFFKFRIDPFFTGHKFLTRHFLFHKNSLFSFLKSNRLFLILKRLLEMARNTEVDTSCTRDSVVRLNSPFFLSAQLYGHLTDDIVMQMRKKGNHHLDLLRLLRYYIVSNEHFTMECPIYCMHCRSILSRWLVLSDLRC